MNNNFNRDNYFSKLIEKANKTMKKEEAQELKRKLIKYGTIGTIAGIIICITGFISFGYIAFSSVESYGMPTFTSFIIPIIAFMGGGIFAGISSTALQAGLAIFVGEKTSEFLDENTYCPKCNSLIDMDEKFCENCGEDIHSKRTCTCGVINKFDSKFCKECGSKL